MVQFPLTHCNMPQTFSICISSCTSYIKVIVMALETLNWQMSFWTFWFQFISDYLIKYKSNTSIEREKLFRNFPINYLMWQRLACKHGQIAKVYALNNFTILLTIYNSILDEVCIETQNLKLKYIKILCIIIFGFVNVLEFVSRAYFFDQIIN